mmetsp:Transcript_18920/g.44010  ORF Transcript_18920/g.44010 Transcript_18920/m.44010 type:complete len:178 (-) Transcript_18920:77-610(-)
MHLCHANYGQGAGSSAAVSSTTTPRRQPDHYSANRWSMAGGQQQPQGRLSGLGAFPGALGSGDDEEEEILHKVRREVARIQHSEGQDAHGERKSVERRTSRRSSLEDAGKSQARDSAKSTKATVRGRLVFSTSAESQVLRPGQHQSAGVGHSHAGDMRELAMQFSPRPPPKEKRHEE